nr:hypothetical protein [Candidatus Sigynarchaeota archaeon]
MLILHMVSEFFDVNGALANIDNTPLITLIALIVFQFLGGLAGLFLLVSAIGNMVSMYRHLQAGKSVKSLVTRQVIGGFLLLAFAMLTESTIGNNGMMGSFADHLNNISATNVASIFYNGFNFETIHTIAWCIVINGIVQGILSVGGRWKNTRQLVLVYSVLAIAVVFVTPFIWSGLSSIGYPFSTNPMTGQPLYKPYLGISPFWEVLLGIFMNPLATPMEPIFPYLAVSFVGSIMGIILAQPRESIPRDFPRKMMTVGMIMFIVGAAGITWVVLDALQTGGFSFAASVYRLLSFHRHWAPDSDVPVTTPLAWLWQFTGLNGFAILATALIIRMVEFRGIGADFAKKTTFIRRFGFVAFTIYAYQWIYKMNRYWFTTLFYGTPYKPMDWAGTWALIGTSLLSFHVIMRLWEKVKYTGTLEWIMGTIALVLVPARKIPVEGSTRWWQRAQLDVEGTFYNAEWLNVVEKDEMHRESLADSKLSFKLSLSGLVSFVFLPATFVTLFTSRTAQKAEGINKYNKVAFVASFIGIAIFVAFLTACIILPASTLISLLIR